MPSRYSAASRLLVASGVTLDEIASRVHIARSSVGAMLDGRLRMQPIVLDVIVELTNDYDLQDAVHKAARSSWIAKNPTSDPDTHLQPRTVRS